jgi:hypothetical protein
LTHPISAVELGTSLDQLITVNKLDGTGFFFGGTMRKARWASVRRTVEEAVQALEEKK